MSRREGTAERPIVFEAAAGEHVVVSGADLLADWRREDEQQQIYNTWGIKAEFIPPTIPLPR